MIKEVLKALVYLNEVCWIIHRDVKGANILLNKRGQVKLSDFGVSAVNKSLRHKKSTFTGSPNWVSPEIIEKGHDREKPNYGYKVDTWSLGITCIELAEMQPPFSNLDPEKAMEMILVSDPPRLKNPQEWSPEFVQFVNICLVKNPNERPNPHSLYQVMLRVVKFNFFSH